MEAAVDVDGPERCRMLWTHPDRFIVSTCLLLTAVMKSCGNQRAKVP